MQIKNNVNRVVRDGLCTSCGICRGACQNGSISFHYGKERNVPVVNTETCVKCGLCYDICPGKGINLVKNGQQLFGDNNYFLQNKYCGGYISSYTGYSSNHDIRFHSASGGMVTTFLLYLLKNNLIDGAVVVRYKNDDPFCPEPFIATSEYDIIKSRGSKYFVVSYDRVIEEVLSFNGKLVVVGLPCQIQGLRNLSIKNKTIRDKIVGYFSIYCSLNKTKHSVDYYLSQYHINREDVGYFSFRDDGCMGYMKYSNTRGETIKKIPYESFWYGSHSFFQNKRCALCADHFGDLADISFGDINIPPYNEDKIGISSLVCRSSLWNDLLQKCKNDGYFELNLCPIDDVIESQSYSKFYKKGVGIQSFFKFRSFWGLKNPQYDIKFEGKLSLFCFIGVFVKYIFFFIGSHKKLWFIIHALDKSSKSAVNE